MARFSTVSLEEARRSLLPPRRATQEQYRDYVRNLSPDTAGRLELGPEDHPITERTRLKAAAKAEGINLEVRRRGSAMVFWLTTEAPKTRAKAPGGGARGGRKSS